MKTVQGPAIFLAQFAADHEPFDTLPKIAAWAASLGFTAVQIPSWDRRLFDLKTAAESPEYCSEIVSMLRGLGLEISELSTHLQGQLVATHPAYETLFQDFAPQELRGKGKETQAWATEQLMQAARASRNLKLSAHASFSGALAWPFVYPWPQRPAGLIDEAFAELARRWTPILNAFDEAGVDLCFELHPGEDLHDGVTFERFLAAVKDHPRANILYDPSHFVLQQLDYLEFLDFYHQRIRAFHVKDAEFRSNGRSGVYGGYQSWVDRPGRFRSLGDGQTDFPVIFSKLAQYDYPGWAVMEWECCLKDAETGAREGAVFIRNHIIPVASRSFDDFAGVKADRSFNRQVLGLSGS